VALALVLVGYRLHSTQQALLESKTEQVRLSAELDRVKATQVDKSTDTIQEVVTTVKPDGTKVTEQLTEHKADTDTKTTDETKQTSTKETTNTQLKEVIPVAQPDAQWSVGAEWTKQDNPTDWSIAHRMDEFPVWVEVHYLPPTHSWGLGMRYEFGR
jgi:hypothetical protein